MRYGSIEAAGEMCLVAIQSGLLDMVAYDIRDGVVVSLDAGAIPLDAYYDIVHDLAREYALRVSYVLKEKKYSPRLVRMMTYIKEHLG